MKAYRITVSREILEGEVKIDEFNKTREVWQCGRCGEICEPAAVNPHLDVCGIVTLAKE